MATTAKIVTDLGVTLRGLRSHEGVVASRIAQAANDDVAKHLRQVEAREQVVTDRVARVLRGLGAPAPRLRPGWLPSPTSLVAAAGTTTQPLGEALVLEATTLRMLADRARVVRGLATALEQRDVVDVTTQVIDLYDEYAGWLVDTASALVVDEDAADLVPTTTQRVAGRVKDAVGAPARVYGRVADQAAAGVGQAVDQARSLVGLGASTVERAGDTAAATVADAAEAIQDAAKPTELPVAGYDDRTAAEAVRALRDLDSVDDVSALVAYEAQHKDRKTVLDAGDKRVAELAAAGR